MIEQRLYYRKTPLPWLFYSPSEFNLKKRIDFSDPGSRIYHHIYIGELTDLSMTGCKGRTQEYPPKESERIWLLFRLPDEELELPGEEKTAGTGSEAGALYAEDSSPVLHVAGEVIWSNRVSHAVYEFGVRFTDFKDNSQSIIETYMFSFDIDQPE